MAITGSNCELSASFRAPPGVLGPPDDAKSTRPQSACMTTTGKQTLKPGWCLQIEWPLSIVISQQAMTQYQLIFRHLFELKYVERQLNGVWQVLQATRGLFRWGAFNSLIPLLLRCISLHTFSVMPRRLQWLLLQGNVTQQESIVCYLHFLRTPL